MGYISISLEECQIFFRQYNVTYIQWNSFISCWHEDSVSWSTFTFISVTADKKASTSKTTNTACPLETATELWASSTTTENSSIIGEIKVVVLVVVEVVVTPGASVVEASGLLLKG